ncbi:MAG: Gfo/Idh/MocA family oxidoreductase [Flavobacteriaceae bacterium]|nr:Gfo/Idh/MocA family oxidoreductase [Flavobacteriaceae bacterium]
MKKFNRRSFIRKSAFSLAALGSSSYLKGKNNPASVFSDKHPFSNNAYLGDFKAPPIPHVRLAIIGVGNRGYGHVQNIAKIDNVEIVGISDLYQDLVNRSIKMIDKLAPNRHPNVSTFYGHPEHWKKMIDQTKPDVLFVCTNWNNHAPMGVYALEKEAHTFIEVPIAVTIDEMWQLVDAAEKHQKHCMMLENVNYGREELLYLNLCRQGVIGDILHGEASYIHDLRWEMEDQERGTGSWRTHHYAKRNGSLYPTHGLGPVAQYMNLCRGEDQFHTLVSMSSPAKGRKDYAAKKYPADHQWNQLEYIAGDMNTSLIKTNLGRTLMVQWDETSPRPYTRKNLIQGTKGTLAGFPTRVALEGGVEDATENHNQWASGKQLKSLYEKYEHPLYKRLGQKSLEMGGHGGMDSLMLLRIFECLHQGLPLDQNVYEGCAWSAVAPLSEQSIANGGQIQVFPDFTRGHWQKTQPLEIII